MKKFLVAAVAAMSITALACTSVESAKVDAATIASNGEAVAVVQATTLGIYLIFNFVALVESNLDVAVNKTLVTEAKALITADGASRVRRADGFRRRALAGHRQDRVAQLLFTH